MSTDSADSRDLQAELESPQAGERGLPVDARCVRCKRVRAKLATDAGDPDDPHSFRHFCHRCKRVCWWNPIRVLDDEPREPEYREGSQ